MPRKNITLIQLPFDKPDCCSICPLCGIIPKNMRLKGSKETHICLATMDAMSGRGINVRASQRDSHHPLKRPCDSRWDTFMRIPNRKLGISYEKWLTFRLLYEQGLEIQIKFHK